MKFGSVERLRGHSPQLEVEGMRTEHEDVGRRREVMQKFGICVAGTGSQRRAVVEDQPAEWTWRRSVGARAGRYLERSVGRRT